MKKLLTPILLIVGIFAGSFGANFLKGSPAEPPAIEGEEHAGGEHDKDGHATDDKHDDKKKKDKKKKDDYDKNDAYGDGGVAYFKFSREFIIPLMYDSEIDSLIILNINLEVDSSVSSTLFSQEPKLRDNVMTTLIELSNDGVTLENIASIESYETVRSMVLKNLKDKEVVGEGILNVLIVDVGKQDV